ncbi:Glycylpeptide N-tetradecanoyltransferase 1 [Galdieria sulphuraria]|nr:Glycylpeptide N-tetradecanoyltransferase 1 [Galdieria sulphuraria]
MVGFWSPHLTATSVKEGPVFSFSSSDISREPFSLTAPELQWVEVNLDIEQEVGHLLRLLNNHYVKDRASVLCYRLSSAFLRWVLRVPGWKKEYLVGVEDKNAQRTFSMIVVNFLCIHEQFRGQGLAPIVIDELSRRAAIDGIFQAVFTSSYTKMFRSLSTALHYHRFLNVPNLVKAGFCRGPRIERYFHVASYQSYQWGPLAVVDVNSVFELFVTCSFPDKFLRGVAGKFKRDGENGEGTLFWLPSFHFLGSSQKRHGDQTQTEQMKEIRTETGLLQRAITSSYMETVPLELFSLGLIDRVDLGEMAAIGSRSYDVRSYGEYEIDFERSMVVKRHWIGGSIILHSTSALGHEIGRRCEEIRHLVLILERKNALFS